MATVEQLNDVVQGCQACSGGKAAEIEGATVDRDECQDKLCQACEDDPKKSTVTLRQITVERGEEASSVKLLLTGTGKQSTF